MGEKKGFTLVELLAVIVILAIILAIAVPGISNIINGATKGAFESDTKMVLQQLEYEKLKDDNFDVTTTNASTITNYNISNTNYDTMDVGIVNAETYIVILGKNKWNGLKACGTMKNMKVVPASDSTTCGDVSGGYDTVQGLNKPVLVSGMIPAYYDETLHKWKKADNENATGQYQWYDYASQKWANAVTVVETGTKTRAYYQSSAVGTIIDMSDINTMFVWIPRYKYTVPAGTGARQIDVVFEAKAATKSTGSAVGAGNYFTHPAFTFGSVELSGIWAGKFETTGSNTNPIVKPDMSGRSPSSTRNNLKTAHDSIKTYMQNGTAIYGFTNDNDIHVMKNTEWGAVALLSASSYGKYGNSNYTGNNKEIYANFADFEVTGRSCGAPAGSCVRQAVYHYPGQGNYTYDGNLVYQQLVGGFYFDYYTSDFAYKTLAYGASTTGTIYGIYDMSGANSEIVMALYKPNPLPTPSGLDDYSGYSTSTTGARFDLLNINSKYYDLYLDSNAKKGEASEEVAGWYSDSRTVPPANNYPWFVRGGIGPGGDYSSAGIFTVYCSNSVGQNTVRLVISPEK